MGLDDVDTDNPEVVKGMIEIFNNLIKEFKPDGFRIDTVKHVNIEFWQQFTPAITEFAQSIGIPQFLCLVKFSLVIPTY
ncbi:alpha-amylase family glycosyl hydrolase [Psychrosphaera algicola]|uniref:Alpha-amylase family glycosyl hydrolase n=1 Tax=Psychrosphaera algicola TaxID=3023714 RepID=A0ABT5FJP0_9GAMM|nr:alpha-amylase family glycosyl hydrolase [Psychrosphaera sp. G1-22]MDC2891396.1 alpha-amylase family glycosyl hydrolase [Psychrosphaera sp. G1-22]